VTEKKLTLEEVIRDAKTIWEPVATGRLPDKVSSLMEHPNLMNKYEYFADCSLCAWDDQEGVGNCFHCPYRQKYPKGCCKYPSWDKQPKMFAKRIMKL
jgi:hypothetical protein